MFHRVKQIKNKLSSSSQTLVKIERTVAFLVYSLLIMFERVTGDEYYSSTFHFQVKKGTHPK